METSEQKRYSGLSLPETKKYPMPADYLHNHEAFPELLRTLEYETGILAGLIEKD